MITADFLIEWAIRSSMLMGTAALLSWLLRVKDPSTRLAVHIAAVCGSLSMPLLIAALPSFPLFVVPATTISNGNSTAPVAIVPASTPLALDSPDNKLSSSSDAWRTTAVGVYTLVAGLLLLRLGTGLSFARKLTRHSRATDLTVAGAEVRESDRVTSPVTIGIAQPVIVLPADWREWDQTKRTAVLAHEQSHVRRRDPSIQCLSVIHRALLWHSPLSWMMHRRIVRLAEDVSDDAAVAAMEDRISYAEMLLDFMQRGVRVNLQGVAMARYGSADDRIHRILHGTILSVGLTRAAMAAIVTLALPLAYVTAAAVPARVIRPSSVSAGASSATVANPAKLAYAQTPAAPSNTVSGRRDASIRRYMIVVGDTQSGSWDSSDGATPEALRARFGNRFAWLRQGGVEHAITDEGVLRDIERAMEPQKKVNAQQDQVNRLQSTVNNLQSKVNSRQDDVNAAQNKVNTQQTRVNAAQGALSKRQNVLNRIQDVGSRESRDAAIRKVEALLVELRAESEVSSQDDVNRLQAQVNAEQGSVNKLQHEVNLEQDRVNAEQQKVNREQDKVNELQRQVSAEFSKRIEEIFESALRRGLAKIVK